MTTVEVYPPEPPRTRSQPPRDFTSNGATWGASGVSDLAPDLGERARQTRSERHRLRAGLWTWSSLPRVRGCGRNIRPAPGGERYVGLRVTGGHAGLSNLVTCGSVWADPVCASKVLGRRAVEIGSLLALAAAEGFVLGFGTFTMRHRAGEPLVGLWAAARAGWKRATNGKSYRLAVARCGVVGWVRVWEVTQGRNGWHVHVHWVVVLEPGSGRAVLDDLAGGMLRRWTAGLAKHSRDALRAGQEWHLVAGDQAGEEVGRYVSKLGAEGLGLELAYSQPGRARSSLKTLPVWSLIAGFLDGGDRAQLGKWHEWERASKGARQVGYSRGLRKRFKVPEVEKTDEEIAAEEMGSEADTLLWITPHGWASMVLHPMRIPELLSTAEVGGLDACRRLLGSWGDVEYSVPAGGR